MASSSSSSSSVLVMPHHFVLPADDDRFPLSVSQFKPPPGVPLRAIAIFANATGVQARFYHRFASWIASQGVAALTFDYRYTGTSFPGDTLRTLERRSGGGGNAEDEYQDRMYSALLTAPRDGFGLNDTWARKDLASVVRYAFRTWAKVPLTVFGHSLGGHLMLVCDYKSTYHHVDPDGTVRTARLLALNAGNPHPKDSDNGTWNEEADYGFHLAGVLTLETDGVFRASFMGLGYDLPYGPGKEWTRWFNHPHFSLRLDEDLKRARENTKHMQYIYFGFEDDATIKKRMMEQQSRMLNVQEGKVQTFWINPASHKPRWPVCGHVDLFIPSKPVPASISQPAAEAAVSQTPEAQVSSENSQAYTPVGEDQVSKDGTDSAQAQEEQSEAPILRRDETIWQVLLQFAVQGTVDERLGAYRRLTTADARDIAKERELEKEFRRKNRRTEDGYRPETGYPEDEPESEVKSLKSKL
ncbi:hypothetical protein CF327_g1931 [Tilletia walkeri]|uniref:Uncharacterized protein n=1 Tax=Tilletia walkeri TaxID=117179 RepID=A0A8X7T453_9BASI|nr:hypothetical protein CF327_g1931 [Tilletia walkeri]KAE8268076.1 hypothetical protein A4X09_0g4276 [Tilletia walkeri]